MPNNHNVNLAQANPDVVTDLPFVSVFMSVYNAENYIQAAVESVLNQTYTHFEFIIVNDGSTDGTGAYLDSIVDPRVRIIKQENQGLGRALNKSMKTCKGKYLMRFDADDICHPTRMEKQVKFLEENPEIIMLGCQMQIFSNEGKGHTSSLFTDHESIVSGMLKGWHTLSHPTTMWRMSLFDHIDGYQISGDGDDWSLLLDAACYGKLAVYPEVLYDHRIHSSSNAWRGAVGARIGLEYAKKRYKYYQKTELQYPYEDFLKYWQGVSWFRKMGIEIKARSSVLYRIATLEKIQGHVLKANLLTLVAALLDPYKTWGAILKKYRKHTDLRAG